MNLKMEKIFVKSHQIVHWKSRHREERKNSGERRDVALEGKKI